jgi:stage II sporulation protein GA (sporulation sigma-E factor processing peptidase)
LGIVTIYLDAVWILNFLFDWMILQLVHWITKSSSKRGRLLVGAFFASLLVPLTFFYPNNVFANFYGKILYSLLIIYAAFGFQYAKQVVKQFLCFYFVSFAIGGGLFGIYFLIGQQIQSNNGLFITYSTGYGDVISWIFVVICFPIVWLFTKKRVEKISYEKMRFDQILSVWIESNGKKVETTGYVDSGNNLFDPFTKKPVIICDEKIVKHHFTEDDWKQIKKCQENWSFDLLPTKWQSKIRMIPFQSVGGTRTFLLVFKPDKIIIHYENQQYHFQNVLIGIQFGELSPDGSYHCLLHPKLMQSARLKTIS